MYRDVAVSILYPQQKNNTPGDHGTISGIGPGTPKSQFVDEKNAPARNAAQTPRAWVPKINLLMKKNAPARHAAQDPRAWGPKGPKGAHGGLMGPIGGPRGPPFSYFPYFPPIPPSGNRVRCGVAAGPGLAGNPLHFGKWGTKFLDFFGKLQPWLRLKHLDRGSDPQLLRSLFGPLPPPKTPLKPPQTPNPGFWG